MKKRKNKKDMQESLNFIIDNMVVNEDFDRLEKKMDGLDAKIVSVDNKLSGFENTEVEKRKKLEVRVCAVEKHLKIKPPEGTVTA